MTARFQRLRCLRLPLLLSATWLLGACVTTVSTYSVGAGADPEPSNSRRPVDASAPVAALGPCQAPPFTPPAAVTRDSSYAGGTVGVEVVIEPAGHVSRVQLVRSSGNATLDAAVVEQMHKVRCSFKPPLTQPQTVRQEFTFRR